MKSNGYKDPDYLKKWRARNKERLAEYRRQRYLAHKDEEIASARRWIRKNYSRHLLQRRAISANLAYPGTGKLGVADVDAIIERCGRRCHWCCKRNLKGRDLTLEHLKPVNDPEHIVIACHACNCARIPTRGPRKSIEQVRAERKAYMHAYYLAHPEKFR